MQRLLPLRRFKHPQRTVILSDFETGCAAVIRSFEFGASAISMTPQRNQVIAMNFAPPGMSPPGGIPQR